MTVGDNGDTQTTERMGDELFSRENVTHGVWSNCHEIFGNTKGKLLNCWNDFCELYLIYPSADKRVDNDNVGNETGS